MGLTGAILGDIAGSRWEFASLNEKRKTKNYDLFTDKNYYTDDTVMSIACKDAVKKAGLFGPNFTKYMRMYGRRYPNAGYGASFSRWLESNKPKPYFSFGNGSAMRCSYIGECVSSINKCKRLAEKSAKVTHNHPEGIKGAIVLAVCVFMAEHNYSKEDILEYAIKEYPPLMEDIDRYLQHGEFEGKYVFSPCRPTSEYTNSIKYHISCQGSVPVAVRCFYETNSFEECMYLINSMEIDTDTVGAIAGAICHSYYKKCTDNDDELLKRYLPDDLYKIAKL